MGFQATDPMASQEPIRQSPPISFDNVIISVTYQTQFGEELFMTGSEGFLGKWKPDAGIKLEWSQGHRWFKKIDMNQLREMLRFEFKFVIRNSGHGYTNWEGGNNHLFDLQFLEKILSQDEVKQHVRNGGNRFDDRIHIGSYAGTNGPLMLAGSRDERHLGTAKTCLFYSQ